MDSDGKLSASLPPAPPQAPAAPGNGSNNAFPRGRPMHGRTSGPTRRSTRGQWTPEEDEILCKAVQRFKGKNWKKIAECFKDRTDVQCLHRWQKVLNPDLIKGPWSKEEDEIIVQLVDKYGPKKWSTIAQHLPGRIGKQCRERWHNHLNPAINKEAWTQEEELVLIRAHQIHGNRWAELTKFLPGRTDNAIKNHWNSSVKKKLDSYLTSGLLAQFQGLPAVSHQNQSMPSASLRVQQSSEDGSFFRDGAEAEEISECSQVGCSQTASDMSNTGCHIKEDIMFSEESDHGKTQNTSPTASCSEQYYTSLDDMTFTIPDIPYEFSCSSKHFDENITKEPEDCGASKGNYGTYSLASISSLELVTDSSSLPRNYFLTDPNLNSTPGPSYQSIEYSAAASINNVGTDTDVPLRTPKIEKGSQEVGDGCPSTNLDICAGMIDMDRYREYISFQSIYQFSETGGMTALQPYNPLNATPVEASNSDNLPSIPSEVSAGNGLVTCTNEMSQATDNVAVSQGQEVVDNAEEGFLLEHNNSSSPCRDHINVGLTEQTGTVDSSTLVPVNSLVSETSDSQQTRPATDKQSDPTCKQEVGTLCYEPPRFPSLDIPFFSCDLAQSVTDAQQEFSPLGIRQLMMSSTNTVTPFKLWDSPSSGDSPEALLKSAAKTFACTPSILKKRHRDLLSPLSPFSERRYDKKTGNDINQGFLCTSRLTKEFSRLDVMFDETDQCKELGSSSYDQEDHPRVSVEDKENVCPSSDGQREAAKDHLPESGDRNLEEETNKMDSNSEDKEGISEAHSKEAVYEDHDSETPRGVLVECHLNDVQFCSPVGFRRKAVLDTVDGAAEADTLKNTSKQVTVSESVICKAGHVLSPTSFEQTKRNNDSTKVYVQPVSTVTSVMVDSLVNEVGAENLNIFGGTPFRRSIESPSAWKSPWYFSSLVPGPRFDADLTIEDFGIFMSPGERSYDAIGLMKQINEQGADAFADAREVLGSETPESILRQRCYRNQNPEGQSNNLANSPQEGRHRLASNVATERRILDFSECGTPAKSMEKEKGVSDARLSSPPCCLLKSYR